MSRAGRCCSIHCPSTVAPMPWVFMKRPTCMWLLRVDEALLRPTAVIGRQEGRLKFHRREVPLAVDLLVRLGVDDGRPHRVVTNGERFPQVTHPTCSLRAGVHVDYVIGDEVDCERDSIAAACPIATYFVSTAEDPKIAGV